MKNWFTSIGGVMVAVGMLPSKTGEPLTQSIGTALEAVGALVLGLSAKDSNVTGIGKEAQTSSEVDKLYKNYRR